MKLFGADKNSGMIRKISDWLGMNFNSKLSPGLLKSFELFFILWKPLQSVKAFNIS